VQIWNELIKKMKKYGFSDRTQGSQIWFLQGASLFCKRGKKSRRAKQKFWGQEVLFGIKFLTFGPKKANLAILDTAIPPAQTFPTCERIAQNKLHQEWDLRRGKSCSLQVSYHVYATRARDVNVVKRTCKNMARAHNFVWRFWREKK